MAEPTGQCRICRRRYRLRGDGTIRAHNRGWDRCAGTGLAPRTSRKRSPKDESMPDPTAPVVDGTTVHTRATTYTVTCLPNDPRGGDAWNITVEFRGAWKFLEPRPADQQWAVVLRGHWHLGHDGKWSMKPSSDDDGYDDWLTAHRFDLETALRVAAEQAPHVVVNGSTPADVVVWRAEP